METFYAGLILMTCFKSNMPKLVNDWYFLFENYGFEEEKEKQIKSCLEVWQIALLKFDKEVEHRNASRKLAFDVFRPTLMYSSASM